jgi:hypothetical protein
MFDLGHQWLVISNCLAGLRRVEGRRSVVCLFRDG